MPVKFTLSNGAVSPTLNGDNFFEWQQAILDTAYAGEYVDILLGKSAMPVDPMISVTPVSLPAVVAASSTSSEPTDSLRFDPRPPACGVSELMRK